MLRHSGGPGCFSEIDILRVKAMANEEMVDFHLSNGFCASAMVIQTSSLDFAQLK